MAIFIKNKESNKKKGGCRSATHSAEILSEHSDFTANQLRSFIYQGIPQEHLDAFYELTDSTKYDIMRRESLVAYDDFREETIDAMDEERHLYSDEDISKDIRSSVLALLRIEEATQSPLDVMEEPSDAQKRTEAVMRKEEYMPEGVSPLPDEDESE